MPAGQRNHNSNHQSKSHYCQAKEAAPTGPKAPELSDVEQGDPFSSQLKPVISLQTKLTRHPSSNDHRTSPSAGQPITSGPRHHHNWPFRPQTVSGAISRQTTQSDHVRKSRREARLLKPAQRRVSINLPTPHSLHQRKPGFAPRSSSLLSLFKP